MKLWRRVERTEKLGRLPGYDHITEVDEKGNYHAWNKWDDGDINGEMWENILNFGWPSVDEFIKARPGFKLVKEEREE